MRKRIEFSGFIEVDIDDISSAMGDIEGTVCGWCGNVAFAEDDSDDTDITIMD